MSEGNCSHCGQTFPVRSLFDLNGATFCERCVKVASKEARERRLPSLYMPLISKSICARCNTYIGSASDAMQVANLRFCAACGPLIKDWDYPQWLKFSLAALLLLLVVALAHGRKYFHAGREMYVGEHLAAEGQYSKALPHLQETLRIAPRSDKAVLLAAKSALLSGDFDSADRALQGHDGGHFENGDEPEFKEVESVWKRAEGALIKAEQANKLADQQGKEIDAARLMHEAATAYPEMPDLAFLAEAYDEGVVFARKDYDAFVTIAEKQWKERPLANTAAALASALACKFAITGDGSYRQRSEEMLQTARRLAKDNPEAMKGLDEFAERNRYRLDSRKIIDKQEYDRLFRNGKNPSK